MSPSRKRTAVEELQGSFEVSQRRACQVVDQPRSSQRYEAQVADEEAKLIARMLDLARQFPRYGYRFIAAKLRQGDSASPAAFGRLMTTPEAQEMLRYSSYPASMASMLRAARVATAR